MAGSASVSTSPNDTIRVTHRVVASAVDSLYPLYPLLGVKRLLTAPALCECRHRGLACRLVAMRWPTVFVVAKGQRPHPRRPDWRGVYLEDAAVNITVGENVEIVVVPLSG